MQSSQSLWLPPAPPKAPEFVTGRFGFDIAMLVEDEDMSVAHIRLAAKDLAPVHVHLDSPVKVTAYEGQFLTFVGENCDWYPHGKMSVVYIPAGVPHAGGCVSVESGADKAILCETRTERRFNDSLELRPDLQPRAQDRMQEALDAYAQGLLVEHFTGRRVLRFTDEGVLVR